MSSRSSAEHLGTFLYALLSCFAATTASLPAHLPASLRTREGQRKCLHDSGYLKPRLRWQRRCPLNSVQGRRKIAFL